MFKEEDHPRDKAGQFAEKDGGEEGKLAEAIKQYSDDPAHDLAAAGLPRGEKPKLSKQEYATLRAEVMRKNATQRGKIKPVNHAFTADHFYVYSTKGDDDFTVMMQCDIERDREKIKSAIEALKNHVYKKRK